MTHEPGTTDTKEKTGSHACVVNLADAGRGARGGRKPPSDPRGHRGPLSEVQRQHQAFKAISTSSSIFLASPNSMRLLSL
jgi:hypothetical protein